MTREQQKELAIQNLQALNVYSPYINAFRSKAQKVCFFEGFGGYYDFQEPEIMNKRKQVEAEHNCTVYAITHESIEDDECYSFLLVSEPDDKIVFEDGVFYAYAYVWNKDHDDFSEFGEIGLESFGGGIKRMY